MAGRKKGEHNLIGCILMPNDKNRKYRLRYKLPGENQTQESFATLEEAKKAQLAVTKRYRDGEKIYLYDEKAKNMTVSDFFEEYSTVVKESEKYGAYATTRTYCSYLRKHFIPICGNQKMCNIKFANFKPHLISLLTGENKDNIHLTAKSAKEIVNAICHFLKISEIIYGFLYEKSRRNEIKESYLKIINEYKFDAVASENPKFYNDLQPWQYDKILQQLFIKDENESDKKSERKNNYLNAIIFIKETGIRAEELAFTWEDFEKGKNTHSLIVNKSVRRKPSVGLVIDERVKTSSSVRNIEINANALMAIQNMKIYQKENNIETDLIFCSVNGNPIDKDNLRKYFKRAAVKVNEEIKRENIYLDYDEQNREIYMKNMGLHCLRKLYVHTKVQEGMNLWEISTLMGHSTTDLTYKKYYQHKDTLIKDWYTENYKSRDDSKELNEQEIEKIKNKMTIPGFEKEHNPTWLALKEMAFLSGVSPKTPEIEERIKLLSSELLKASEKVNKEILEERKKYKYLFHR